MTTPTAIRERIATSFRFNVAELIKTQMSVAEAQGIDETVVMGTIAKVLNTPVSAIQESMLLMALPSEIIGLMRVKPISPHVALSVWRKTNENPGETKRILVMAAKRSAAEGARKVMLRHAIAA